MYPNPRSNERIPRLTKKPQNVEKRKCISVTLSDAPAFKSNKFKINVVGDSTIHSHSNFYVQRYVNQIETAYRALRPFLMVFSVTPVVRFHECL